MTPSNFILRTALGAPIYTTDDKRKAVSEACRLRSEFPGLYIEETYTPPPVVRRIWTDRQGDNVVMMRAAR